MKYFVGIFFSLSLLIGAQVLAQGQAYSISQCRDMFYEGAGANYDQALNVCVQRSDVRFVQCVVDQYNDYSQSNSFESSVSICSGKIGRGINVGQCQNDFMKNLGVSARTSAAFCQQGLSQTFTTCVRDLREKLDFTTERGIQLCQWSEEQRIYLCAQRKYKEERRSNEQSVLRCYEEYNRGELNSRGENPRELAEAARRNQQAPKAPATPKAPSVPKAPAAPKAPVVSTPKAQPKPSAPIKTQEPVVPKAPKKSTPEPKQPETSPSQPATPPTVCQASAKDCDDGGVIVDLPNL